MRGWGLWTGLLTLLLVLFPSCPFSSRDQKLTLRPLKCVIHAQRLLEWLEAEGDIASREEGVAFGQDLYAAGILRHGVLALSVSAKMSLSATFVFSAIQYSLIGTLDGMQNFP